MKSSYQKKIIRPLACVTNICSIALLTILFIHCDPPKPQEGGRFEPTPKLEYNRGVVSPIIIVPPLLACGKSVTVKGFVPDARIRIYAGTTLLSDKPGWDPEGQTFSISPDLTDGQVITATQEFEGTESGSSLPVTVQKHTEVYPAGLPKPGFPHLYLYNCGIATVVDNLPPGGTVRVFSHAPPDPVPGSTVGHVDGVSGSHSIGIGPAFVENHRVSAESQICSDISPRADEQIVRAAPSTLPTPEVTGIYEGGTIITVHQLVNGSKVTIKRGGTTISGGGAPGSHVRFHVSVIVNAGDVLEITQELCGVTSTGTVTVQPCSSLPPAKLLAPRAGDEIVYLTEVVDGSRIRIFSVGQEIADGGGSAIQLTRPLVENETLIVVQSIGACISVNSYVVEVGHGLDDPLTAGPCGKAQDFEYGHSGDPGRQTTDVSDYFNSPSSSVSVSMDAVPLHAVVRYPSGPGPFPLVLIVHGNHNPSEVSYPGYNYLLDHFASHCMIAVSVEEDFLNGNVSGEMDARAIVLLRHLQLWREWNRTPGHRFYGKVAEGSIGLAGHSRGGEAIVAAELFNHSLHTSGDPAHDFNFGIRSLYAIAPVDGQFDAGPPIVLSGADYYVMHGSHDGDVAGFDGHRLYDRAFPVNGSTNNFKGLLYIYGANHGHWNSIWTPSGEFVVGPSSSIISESNQKLIGKSYMTSFYLASLKGWNSYRYFLNGEVTFPSLPSAITRIFQYQDPKKVFVNHYEEDDDLATGSQPGITNSTSGTLVKYEDYSFTDTSSPHFLWEETDGLIAGWQNVENAEIHIKISGEVAASISQYEFLAFRVGQTLESSPSLNTVGVDKDMSIQVLVGSSPGIEVHTSNYQPLPYPMVSAGPSWGGPKSVMQTIRIPLKDLVKDARELERISEIIIKFNRQTSGIVALDEIQFTN